MILYRGTTPALRATIRRLADRIEARRGLPRDGAFGGGGIHVAAQATAFGLYIHPVTGERALFARKARVRVTIEAIMADIDARVLAGTATAFDTAIRALVPVATIPANFFPKGPFEP